MTTAHTWDLSPAEYHATVEKIAAINTRAAKRGWTGRYRLAGEEVEVERTDDITGLTLMTVVMRTTLTGDPPCYEGSAFLAKVDWNEHEPILYAAPGVEGIDRSVLIEGHCAHCNTQRFRRNTFIVQTADGAQVQVGSTCIKDFLGWKTMPVFLPIDDLAAELDQEYGGIGRQLDEESYTPLTVIRVAWATITAFGYVPAAAYTGCPTATSVKYALGYWKDRHGEHADDLRQIRPLVAEADAKAREILAFVLSDDFNGSSEYVLNLKTVAAASHVEGRFIGLLASAPQAYAKHLDETLIRKAETHPSRFVGEPGDKIQVAVTLANIRHIDGAYGTTTLYTMREAGGNVFKWFSSRPLLGDRIGRELTLAGTVKGHEEYCGVKSTILTRCKEKGVS